MAISGGSYYDAMGMANREELLSRIVGSLKASHLGKEVRGIEVVGHVVDTDHASHVIEKLCLVAEQHCLLGTSFL